MYSFPKDRPHGNLLLFQGESLEKPAYYLKKTIEFHIQLKPTFPNELHGFFHGTAKIVI